MLGPSLGRVRRAKNDPSAPSSLDGACSGDKFVVSKAGQVYDAPESEPNRKSRLISHSATAATALLAAYRRADKNIAVHCRGRLRRRVGQGLTLQQRWSGASE